MAVLDCGFEFQRQMFQQFNEISANFFSDYRKSEKYPKKKRPPCLDLSKSVSCLTNQQAMSVLSVQFSIEKAIAFLSVRKSSEILTCPLPEKSRKFIGDRSIIISK
jgi:hypothetical protein